MDFAAILTSTPVLALLGYAAFVVVLQLALQPMRLQMVDIAEEMLSEGHWNKDQREDINTLLDGAASMAFSIVLPIAILVTILKDIIGVRTEVPQWMKRLAEDPRYHALIRRFCVSLLGANPLAAVITIPLIAVGTVVGLFVSRAGYQRAIEEPVAMLAQGRRLA